MAFFMHSYKERPLLLKSIYVITALLTLIFCALSQSVNAGMGLALEYNPLHNRYIAVHSKVETSPDTDIVGKFVFDSGSIDRELFIEIYASGNQSSPVVAFDSSKYLVAWESGNANSDIIGRFIFLNGVIDTSAITISDDVGSQKSPAIAHDSSSQYLIVWEDGDTDTNILGRFVNDAGVPDPSVIPISTVTGSQTAPALASDGNNRYLAVWVDNDGSDADIAGAIIDTAGNILHSVTFTNGPQDEANPAVVYNSASSQFLVIWETSGSSQDISGQLVNAADGQAGNVITIANGPSIQTAPSAAHDSANNRFLVAWEDSSTGGILASYVNSDGTLIQDSGISASNDAGTGTATSYHDQCGNFLVAFIKSGSLSFAADTICGGTTPIGGADSSISAAGGGCFIGTAASGR